MECLILYYFLANNTENNYNEEAEQVREHEERLHVMKLQFTSVSCKLVMQLDNFATETLFYANDNSIFYYIFALRSIAG